MPGASVHTAKPSADLELPAPRQRRIMKTGQQSGRRARARKPPTGPSAGCMDTAFMMPTLCDVRIMLHTSASACVVDGQIHTTVFDVADNGGRVLEN